MPGLISLRTLARLLAPWRTIRRLEATVQRLQKILADNYLQLTFDTPEGLILVTVQRPGGASPHSLRAMAEQEARNLRAELARLQGDPEAHF